MLTKKINKLVVAPLVFILILTIGITYALFTKNVNTKDRMITLSTINKFIGIYGSNKNNIELNKDYTFTIENRGAIDAGYQLYIDTEDTVDLSSISYTISGDENNSGTLTDANILTGNLKAGSVITIVLRLAGDGTYSGKINCRTVDYHEPTILDLSFINSVSWTTSHSGNAKENRGIYTYNASYPNAYLLNVGGAASSTSYYTHTFRTNLIPIAGKSVLKFSHFLYKENGYSPSGTVTIYDKNNSVLYSSTTLGSVEKEIEIPDGGFSIYLRYYGPGNWFGRVSILEIKVL